MAAGVRDHGRVLCKIWNDKDFRALPRTAQCLYIQLLSQKEVTNAGVLPLMLSKWAKGCDDLTSEQLLNDLAVLVDGRFIVVDTETEEVLIRSFIRSDGGMAHKYIFKNALTCAEAVESPAIRKVLAAELRRTRRSEARATIALLDPSEPDSEPSLERSESGSNAEVNPSESHSNPTEIPPESGMAFQPHSNHSGVGVGEGVGESLVVGHLGEVAGAHTRDAHTREDPSKPQSELESPPAPWCTDHPGGTSGRCGACGTARTGREAWDANQLRLQAVRKSEQARQSAADRALAITTCAMCDVDGFVGREYGRTAGVLCDHDPSRRTQGSREEARALIAEMRKKRNTVPTPEELARIHAELATVAAEPDPDPLADQPSREDAQPVSGPSSPQQSASQDQLQETTHA